MKDVIIFHLTDLHFPTDGTRPPWADRFLKVVEDYVWKDHYEIYAFAITGDLVNSPTLEAYNSVNNFLNDALKTAGLISEGQLKTSRLWIVGGNHDYKKYGAFWKTKTTISDSKLTLLENSFKDPEKSFHVFGLHSGNVAKGARGRIKYEALEAIENELRPSNSDSRHIPDFRIALLHHHLVPLPSKPVEWLTGNMEKIQSYIEDEAFMLLGNAGLTTAILIDHMFHLALHGHKHRRFISRILYCTESMTWKQPLTIVGGKKATDGFNVIRFSKSGNVDLKAYEMENINYIAQPPIQLWSYDEWKLWNWDNQKQINGYCKEAFVQNSISNIGDTKEKTRVRQIFGSDTNSIEDITFNYRAIPEDRAALRIESLYDYQNKREMPLGDANRPQAFVSKNFILDPAATQDVIHGGYNIEISGRNIFSVTTNDASLRPKGNKAFGVDDKHERYSFHLKFPVEELELWLRFPQGFKPEQVEIFCNYLDSEGKEVGIDFPETARSQSCLDYDPDFGVLCFKMKRITPNNRYYITWELPELKMDSIIYDQEIDAQIYFDELFNYNAKDKKSWINIQLKRLKSDLLNADLKDIYSDREALDIGFFVLSPKGRELVPVGGTYKHHSNYWKFHLPWGMGIRGLALRRGQPEFFPLNPLKKPGIYIKPDHCEEDKFLLAVPIVIPPGIRFLRNEHSPGFFKAVVCVGSPSQSSGLNKLKNLNKMKEICDIIKKMGQNMWKESPLA